MFKLTDNAIINLSNAAKKYSKLEVFLQTAIDNIRMFNEGKEDDSNIFSINPYFRLYRNSSSSSIDEISFSKDLNNGNLVACNILARSMAKVFIYENTALPMIESEKIIDENLFFINMESATRYFIDSYNATINKRMAKAIVEASSFFVKTRKASVGIFPMESKLDYAFKENAGTYGSLNTHGSGQHLLFIERLLRYLETGEYYYGYKDSIRNYTPRYTSGEMHFSNKFISVDVFKNGNAIVKILNADSLDKIDGIIYSVE
jgi:hypothetical protein